VSARFDRVAKSFGETVALADFTLDVGDGEFMVLLGPSGCGKTTALRILAGLEEPTAGDVYIDERNVTELAPRERDIAMVFQNYALYPQMSVYNNIAFGLRMRKISRTELDATVRDVAGLLGIGELLKRKPGQLSGGQRQRVALARAIVRRPKAFLMDEPLSNLDAKLRAQTRLELIRLHRRIETTVLYVTHDQVEAMTMGQRIAIMDRGMLQQVGTADDVYARPANLFVAEFIGSPAMSLFRGDVREKEGMLIAQTPAIAFTLFDDLGEVVRRNAVEEVVVGARPEHIDLAEVFGERRAAATFSAQVDVVESLGSEVHATLLVDGRGIVVRLAADEAPRAGETRRFAVAPEHLLLFDPVTGRRLT
jgi:multiple sugar transport system ATP-binding protein